MNPERMKTIEVDGRKFLINKFDARLGIKVKFLLVSKILPAIDMFLPMVFGGNMNMANIGNDGFLDNVLTAISFDRLAEVIAKIDDSDLDKLINYSLSHCFEQLPAGPTRVLNPDGTYGVDGVEYDGVFMLRLVIETVWWGVAGFLDGSRWTSIFKPLADLFPQGMPTSMSSSTPPLPEGTGDNTNFGMEPTP